MLSRVLKSACIFAVSISALTFAATPPLLTKEKASEMIKASDEFIDRDTINVYLSSGQVGELEQRGYLEEKVNWFIHSHEVTSKGAPFINYSGS